MADDDTTDETQNTQDEAVEKVEKVEPTHADEQSAEHAEAFAETFKTAAQKVLEERFGMQQNEDGTVDFSKLDSEKVKANAQALIGGLMSQLAGVTPAQTDDKAPPPPAQEDDNVIDLEAARRARAGREPSELERRISESFKSTFDTYIQQNFVPDGAQGSVDLKLDGAALREHGPQLLTALFGAFSKSIFPEEGVTVTVGGQDTPEPKEASPEAETSTDSSEGEAEVNEATPDAEVSVPSDDGAPAEDNRVEVNINVDLAGMFRGLIDSVKPKP